MKAPKKLAGKWRITETEMWDAEELDLVGPAHLTIAADGFGSFQMVGDDDGSEVSGRGWAEVGRDGVLRGRIYFHQGDESAFVARRSRSR